VANNFFNINKQKLQKKTQHISVSAITFLGDGRCLPFCNYLSVLFLRIMDSDHLFGIFKLFLHIKRKELIAQA
jgi:hypothetical protein